MLANGATLGYKENSGLESGFTILAGLKEIPEMGIEPEKVENTCLADKNKSYEMGIGDAGELKYKFKYENDSSTSPYRKMREYESNGKLLDFEETLKDGTKTHFSGQVSVKRTGGGVNGVIDFDLTVVLQSAIEVVDPSPEAA